jgi:hypothetical protein
MEDRPQTADLVAGHGQLLVDHDAGDGLATGGALDAPLSRVQCEAFFRREVAYPG